MKFLIVVLALSIGAFAQKPPAAGKGLPPAKIDKGSVLGQTYLNSTFRFQIEFPDDWVIAGDDFAAKIKAQGFDLSLKAPGTLGLQTKAQLNKALRGVTILLTAYRPGSEDSAIVRISAEDLKTQPQIKDAVDYFDAMRAAYAATKLPADFKYSETNAEQLGRRQFAYLDISDKSGRKRMYATVRDRHAILITISFKNDDDLATLRQTIAEADFNYNGK
jgi:hypothetical protein